MSRALTTEKLARHFSRADHGAGSNYEEDVAAVLARGQVSVDCRACSGRGYRDVPEADLRKWEASIAEQTTTEHRDQVRQALSRASDCPSCRGSGKVPARRGDHAAAMDSMWTTVCCGTCHGCGETTNPTDTSAERQDVCLACGGASYIVPVTVRTKGSGNGGASGGSSGLDGDAAPLVLASPEPAHETEHDASEHVRIAHDLDALRAQDPQLAAALASFHGPEGDAWVEHRWGRGFVVWQHTPAGRQLAEHVAEQSIRGCGHLVAPLDRIARARETQERPPVGRAPADHQLQRSLLGRADREARELLRRVRAVAEVESAA